MTNDRQSEHERMFGEKVKFGYAYLLQDLAGRLLASSARLTGYGTTETLATKHQEQFMSFVDGDREYVLKWTVREHKGQGGDRTRNLQD